MRRAGFNILDPRLSLRGESFRKCIRFLDTDGRWPAARGSLEVAFVDEAECARLHAAFFNDPSVTDVMTFPGEPGDRHAGDIAICPAMAAREARDRNLPFPRELTLYLVHGWLHLAGLDDRAARAAAEMRRAEAEALRGLGDAGCLLEASWAGSP